ncbi:MAG: carbohydrate kinase [Selenomonadaceae bacterium]|nr:carbohydrate kinase [Selenomonadaceae bacterium]
MQNLKNIVNNFRDKKILVVGDLIADVYLDGRISRISREAPVLILEEAGKKVVAGGAANVIANAATLGGKVYAVGVVGADDYAESLKNILSDYKVDVDGIVPDKSRPTISKTRIIAGGRATVSQQIVRIDRESKEPLDKKIESELIKHLEEILSQVDGIILSDYGAGTVTDSVKNLLINYASKNKIPSMVDSRYRIGDFKGIGYVKQNDSELAAHYKIEINDEKTLIDAGKKLLAELNSDGVLITRGELGMSLFERGGAVHHIPVTDKSEVFDVSGAGDTCVASFLLAMTTGTEPVKSARIANYAAGVAVRKLGTATVSANELLTTLKKFGE